MGRQRRRRLPAEPVAVEIHDLAHDGRGVGRIEDKVVFVHGALPGERVLARLTGRNRKFDEAIALAVEQASDERVEPRCEWFGNCGGCALQHLDAGAQVRWKQGRLVENLKRIGGVAPERWLEPVVAEPWNYRRRARLSARWVPGKGRVLVGFREVGGRYVAEIEGCEVLHPVFADRLMSLSALIGGLSIPDRVAQVECAAGDDSAAIVLRHLEPLTDADLEALVGWSEANGIAVWLQPKGPDTVHRLHPAEHRLSYRLDAFDLELVFHPQHFVQVNAAINRQLTERAVDLLDCGPDDRVLDLFCGLGNFSLPLATRAGAVLGVELDAAMVQAAERNAAANGLTNARFKAADLQQPVEQLEWLKGDFDRVLIDPPRSGALEVLPVIAASGARRVVYVSCDPATLARDAGELVRTHGYRLASAGVADMFPHTAHVESIAVFEREAA
ncbi:23S rRNA (uracil(1939)-C(5))-methyltransferase RlmD [Wenzhouxiangella sp. XN79A]|uniref:23S rRNA (uracil(1939)-C(5))-methyltransferase RlmD n=1 Tax=Wenzhouxiangella sp. XN79A TaxID=2724193 RepID=UPI00144AA010|nr:23S rRNA (uracil(1939)-C(5))-methyltransferase RlmD [Wenzhouxiangella sp. XN79A]NKI34412.1 23S rRNA (uracil(1939)-C(5))-methyltransferase RlmD [Wenzhouxiangella sp. XN79A]